MKIYLSKYANGILCEYLRRAGHELCFVTSEGVVSEPLSAHPDMFMCKMGVREGAPVVFYGEGSGGASSEQRGGELLFHIEGDANTLLKYPLDIRYNAACTGKYFIHNLKYSEPELLEYVRKINETQKLHDRAQELNEDMCEARGGADGVSARKEMKEGAHKEMKTINVRQGYTKCSTVIVDEDSIITYDKGIAEPCRAAGMDVLLVEPGHVILPGYDTGFIGGASGRVGDEIIFNGDLDAHPDAERIRDFIAARDLCVVSFPDYPLTDIGSII